MSIVVSSLVSVVGLACWWLTAPGLWELATFTPTGPIRPMGLGGVLGLGAPVSIVLWLVSIWSLTLSQRSAARTTALLGMMAAVLPGLNLLLFFGIIAIRGIELSS